VLFVVANLFPFLSFGCEGRVIERPRSPPAFRSGSRACRRSRRWSGFTAWSRPSRLALLLYVLLPVHLGRVPWQMPRMFRLLRRIQPWSMMEVFLVGILVAVTKLVDMASVVPGLALWAFAGLIVVLQPR
jgi:paraquat-inducible protein A